MSVHTRKHPTKHRNYLVRIYHAGAVYQFPKNRRKYRVDNDKSVSADDVFATLNENIQNQVHYCGIRIR